MAFETTRFMLVETPSPPEKHLHHVENHHYCSEDNTDAAVKIVRSPTVRHDATSVEFGNWSEFPWYSQLPPNLPNWLSRVCSNGAVVS